MNGRSIYQLGDKRNIFVQIQKELDYVSYRAALYSLGIFNSFMIFDYNLQMKRVPSRSKQKNETQTYILAKNTLR